ncbi:hypothetical protein L3Y34_016036 [Caenorhabditis briggsae]|uniref:BTB domain-containing protein n=1 Tax=Caenorhabditis briggsae TaxID=6238 RepID=A0AAE9DWB9_CAEBR|nr:hypothetical protein L3Y34_016036 [Caenorhabditis briggsae]
MTDNREPETEPREDIKADLQSEKNVVLEKLKTVAAETEEIKNSQKQKFDEFAEKLQSIEDAVSKMSILSNNPCNTAQESVKKFILKHEFKNLNKLKEMEDPSSELFEYFNADWCLRASCTGGSVYITIWGDTKQSDMSIETELKFRLIGFNNFTKIMKHCFRKPEGENDYLDLEEIEKWRIPKNVTVEVEVEILKMTGIEKKKLRTFDESQKDVSDVVLVVHDTRFYVSKMYLASQSTYFKTLFLGGFSESKKSEITLSGIDADEFQHFLEVLYGEFAIDDFTVEGILLIADLYDTPIVTKKCEMFLLKESKKEFNKKLQLSSKFRLGELKTQCLAKINTLDNVRELLPGDLSDLDPLVALTILQKCVDSK